MEILTDSLFHQKIICISTSDWEKPYGSRQNIMSRLALNNQVLFVESQSSIFHLVRHPLNELKRLSRWLKGISQRENLYLYTPPPLLPFGNYSGIINAINQNILLYLLKRLVKKISFSRPILWIYTVNSAPIIGKLGEILSVYYCIDDFSSEKRNTNRQKVMYSLEDELLKGADVVFTCSKTLCEDRRARRPDIHFLRNGVDLNVFKNTLHSVDDCHSVELRGVSGPRFGFVGTLDARIDTGLLFYLAETKSDWHLVLIGMNSLPRKETLRLQQLPNIHFLGFKPHKELPGYIRAFDVCFIPYRTQGFSRYIFPIKTLEYLALGKAVVSTYLPELEEFKEVVRLTRNNEEFMQSLETCLADKGNNGKGVQAAARHSWDEKVNWLSGIIHDEIKKRQHDN